MYNSFERKEYDTSVANGFITRTYGWMSVALLISGITAFGVNLNPALLRSLLSGGSFFILAIAEIGLVIWLTHSLNKISYGAAILGFLAYAFLNGLTLSSVFIIYGLGTVFQAFGVCALMFAIMSIYGKITNTNLASYGKYFSMALIGLLIASLLSIFIPGMNLMVSIVGVVLFTALTAYDTQKLYKVSSYAGNNQLSNNASIFFALQLYLDFINIFLYLLRIFGRRR